MTMEYSVEVYNFILILTFLGYASANEKTEKMIVEENINGSKCIAVTEFYADIQRVSTLCECLAYKKNMGNAPSYYGRLEFFVKLEDALARRIVKKMLEEMEEEGVESDIDVDDIKRILLTLVICDSSCNQGGSFTLYISSKPRIFIEVKRNSFDGPVNVVKDIMEFPDQGYQYLGRCQWLNTAIKYLFTADGKKNKETWVPTLDNGYHVMYRPP